MKKQLTCALLALLMLTPILSSCSDTPTDEALNTTAPADSSAADTTTGVPEEQYPYPEEGLGGKEIRFFSIEDLYDIRCGLLVEEQTGLDVDDLIRNRNIKVETELEVVLVETKIKDKWNFERSVEEARRSVISGADEYQVMYLPAGGTGSLMTEKLFLNLANVDTIQLNEEWWYQSYNDALTIRDCIYGAMGGSNLGVHDGQFLMIFNKDMMSDLSLELPYDTVRNGDWTMDKLGEYLTAAASLNGDASAAWLKNGKAVYGYAHLMDHIQDYIISSGEFYVTVKDGEMAANIGSDRFYELLETMRRVFTTTDAKAIACLGNTGTGEDGKPAGDYVFTHRRALFSLATVAQLQQFRDVAFEYGVLPYPKLNDVQDRYYAKVDHVPPLAIIPKTNQNADEAGLVLDALAYEGEKSVVPTYREKAVEQRGLRDRDSIDMLKIITDNAVPEIYKIFGIDYEIITVAGNYVWKDAGNVSSTIASKQNAVELKIKAIMNQWGKDE